jgi:hypothetical protein
MAFTTAAGLKCIYRCVVVKFWCPANSWIALLGAPRIARCEQNVWRKPDAKNPSFQQVVKNIVRRKHRSFSPRNKQILKLLKAGNVRHGIKVPNGLDRIAPRERLIRRILRDELSDAGYLEHSAALNTLHLSYQALTKAATSRGICDTEGSGRVRNSSSYLNITERLEDVLEQDSAFVLIQVRRVGTR